MSLVVKKFKCFENREISTVQLNFHHLKKKTKIIFTCSAVHPLFAKFIIFSLKGQFSLKYNDIISVMWTLINKEVFQKYPAEKKIAHIIFSLCFSHFFIWGFHLLGFDLFFLSKTVGRIQGILIFGI